MDTTTSVTNELRSLLSLIVDSAAIAQRHIPDREKLSQGEPIDSELRSSIFVIEAACAQLCSLIARPSDALANKFFAFYEPACIQVVLTNKIPDILQEYPSGVHISELEKRTGVDAGKLGRVLRLLAAKHLFQEVSADTFANNYLSKYLLSSNPMSSFGLHITDECFKASTNLSDTLNDPALTASASPADASFVKHFKVNGTLFDYYAGSSPEQVKRATQFGVGMIGWGDAIEANAVINEFPWGSLPEGTTICDVGGGVGNISTQLANSYPALRLILQDLPHQLKIAEEEVWPEHAPKAIAENRIEFIPFDFLQEAPKLGCDIYYVKNILHDWADGDCIKILKNVKNAMGTSSRVLVHEFIVRPGYRMPKEEAKFTQAPEPLLPNYGEGRIRQYTLDINMMTMLNSKERTLQDFIDLGETAGLQFVKIWEAGEMGLVEFVTKA
ncbi:hypothetical protein AGABI1DRAFT_79240 [Agaricus bisporus var. burnettii JB137-S8]|uniref:Uncharacterized protein n=1 Tax=Agaricus bisporus var. burnettii (strain JB137-S8 / ATCC MYA-4627 / FGSC 10392) TaxID=597362 RepID=K5WL36_AGABU|nr:uncharacterized protein AGABI1DRAFT_79240 [Agaricus bisporus var. burnettii JB137-S8]EKM76021.1 hypothetical protein AGABI1DRAFT_79240 [Agaricus bisporus var. burnettii JB137-S8]